MTKTEILDVIKNGESSSVEFKRDDVENFELAKELVAFLNFQGGMVLLGIADDGSIYGTSRENLEDWVAALCRVKIEPPIIPHLTWIRGLEPEKNILVVRVPIGPDKPYARVHKNHRTYYIRVGGTSVEAGRDELERMFQASGRIQYGLKPVPGSSLDDLDRRRLKDYLGRVLGSSYPSDENAAEWERLLLNMDLLIKSDDLVTVTIDGMLLFGKNPKRFIPQSGIRAIAYPGDHPDYATRADQDLKGAMTPLFSQDGAILEPSLLESSLVEQALDFIKRNTEVTAHLEGGARRVDRPSYPEEVLREVIVNSLVHRDYSIAGTDISLNIFADRLEVRSPGPLPNTVTVDGLKVGLRYARNQTLVNVMRDYRYVDFRGMGIRQKVIPGMFAHNGTEPDFIADEWSFTVRLWKENQSR